MRDSQLCRGSALLVSCNLSAALVASQANAISIWEVKSERERHWRGEFGWRWSRQARTRETWRRFIWSFFILVHPSLKCVWVLSRGRSNGDVVVDAGWGSWSGLLLTCVHTQSLWSDRSSFSWWIVRSYDRSVRGRSSMSLYNFDEWNASFMAMVWVVIVNMMWTACMWGIVCALRLWIEQDLREGRCRGHERKGGKTSETWTERGSVAFVRVFVGRPHPLSFGYSVIKKIGLLIKQANW